MADERGAPTDFGGAVFPNPDNVAPVLDTEIGPPQKINANINNAPLVTPKGNIDNAPLGNPAYSRRVQYPTGQIVAFPDHLSPEEFDKAAKKVWGQFKEQ
jgi:hypothetical protein